jgi:MoxR-like ATPase
MTTTTFAPIETPFSAPSTPWQQMEWAAESPEIRTMYVWGAPGIGKTYVAMRSGLRHRKCYVTTLTQEMPAAELRGHWLPKGGGEFIWHHGIVVRAMLEGARLVINELPNAGYDVVNFLYPVLEHTDTCQIDLPSGETVFPAPGFEVICTGNEGLEVVPEALRDRFQVQFYINQPHPDALESINPRLRPLAQRCFENAAAAHSDAIRPSIRAWHTVQALEEAVGTKTAFRMTFGEGAGDELYSALVLSEF